MDKESLEDDLMELDCGMDVDTVEEEEEPLLSKQVMSL